MNQEMFDRIRRRSAQARLCFGVALLGAPALVVIGSMATMAGLVPREGWIYAAVIGPLTFFMFCIFAATAIMPSGLDFAEAHEWLRENPQGRGGARALAKGDGIGVTLDEQA